MNERDNAAAAGHAEEATAPAARTAGNPAADAAQAQPAAPAAAGGGSDQGASAAPAEACDAAATATDAGTTENAGAGKVVKGPGQANIDLVLRIPVKVEVVLGTARMTIAELMQLGPGAVVRLDRHVGEPIDVMVNGRLVARGEVVVDENDETRLGIRLTEIVEPNTFC